MAKYLFAEIKKEDVKRLFEFLKSEKEYIKKRAHLLILSGIQRYKVPEISKIVNIHPNHLRKWIHRYNRYGLKVILESPKTGKKKKFQDNVKKRIIDIVMTSPRKLGLLFSLWTLNKIKQYLEEKKIVDRISHETIRRILKETNIDIRKIKYQED
jgi:transposase